MSHRVRGERGFCSVPHSIKFDSFVHSRQYLLIIMFMFFYVTRSHLPDSRYDEIVIHGKINYTFISVSNIQRCAPLVFFPLSRGCGHWTMPRGCSVASHSHMNPSK